MPRRILFPIGLLLLGLAPVAVLAEGAAPQTVPEPARQAAAAPEPDAAAPPKAAATPAPARTIRWDFGLFTGALMVGDGSGLGNTASTTPQVLKTGAAPAIGLHAGATLLNGRLGLEAEFRDAFAEVGGNIGGVQLLNIRAQVLGYIMTEGPLMPFVLAGVGQEIVIGGDNLEQKVNGKLQKVFESPEADNSFFGGLGVQYAFTDKLGLRATGRYLLGEPQPETKKQVDAGEANAANHNFEFLIGVTYSLGGKPQDSDNDGVADQVDRCIDKPEDKDGLEDADGCPDADNDGDGIADADDRCMFVSEDKDSFEDEDGCPDNDNDNDGIADAKDKCINEAEDRDGLSDDDGCPDFDDDGDGLENSVDKCPTQKEDKDSFQDTDGCPDLDNDDDGVPDLQDKCPMEPENKNGLDDADGCPDKLSEAAQKLFGAPVEMEFKGATLGKTAETLLESLLEVLLENDGVKIEIAVQANADSDAARKQAEFRAAAVRVWLEERGIDAGRLQAVVTPPQAGAKAPSRPGATKVQVTLRIL
jgi:hypothetical protein